MEEEEEEEASAAMDTNYPSQKLDFNAPLLSTRRVMISNLELPRNMHGDTHNRVPFSWEQSPGNPKHTESLEINSPVPPPKPPPGWQHPVDQEIHYDGDNDDDDDDAMDTFSLSEALDIMVEHRNMFGDFNLEARRGSESPSNFIIQRFLSDAKALAVSSSASLNISKNYGNRSDFEFPGKSCAPQGVVTMESCSSPKGCGLDAFFPWRMKHKPCGLKSPVRVASTNVKPPPVYCSTKQKQNCSSGQSPGRSGVSMIFSSTSNSNN